MSTIHLRPFLLSGVLLGLGVAAKFYPLLLLGPLLVLAWRRRRSVDAVRATAAAAVTCQWPPK